MEGGGHLRVEFDGGWVGYQELCPMQGGWIIKNCVRCRVGGSSRIEFDAGWVDHQVLGLMKGDHP